MYSDFKIAVMGDYMTDEWWEATDVKVMPGSTAIDIINPTLLDSSAGGSGNVFLNLKDLGAQADLYVPETQLAEHKKIYYSHKGAALPRISIHPSFHRDETRDEISLLLRRIKKYDAVIIAEYDKGWCTDDYVGVIEMCGRKGHNIPVMVDPKFDNWDVFKGATIFKPNRAEWVYQSDFTKEQMFLHDWFKNIVVTLSEDGMRLYAQEYKSLRLTGHPVEVFDVTGAGDTCMAVMTLEYLRTGGDILKAARLANLAGSLVVQKHRTVSVTVDQLKEAGGYGE